ncbi:hypothetical protein PIB30_094217 [Stylosanthes scabra]|uniref:Uncharacterized protein n=1 Tax=Stylosanthes scabra TaxID=79078 RepID=A0ABU6SVS5_9FABA|nr:hypothetical protein [Stylosanthes scabra]
MFHAKFSRAMSSRQTSLFGSDGNEQLSLHRCSFCYCNCSRRYNGDGADWCRGTAHGGVLGMVQGGTGWTAQGGAVGWMENAVDTVALGAGVDIDVDDGVDIEVDNADLVGTAVLDGHVLVRVEVVVALLSVGPRPYQIMLITHL